MSLYEIHLRVQKQISQGGEEKPSVARLAEIYKTKGWTAISLKEMLRIEFGLFGRHLTEGERLLEINKCNSKWIIENYLKRWGFFL